MAEMSDLVAAIDSRITNGGVENIMQPAKLVSVDPPIVEVCGVQIEKQLHVNPALRSEADFEGITSSMDTVMERFGELDQVKDSEGPEIVEAMKGLAAPLNDCFTQIKAFLEKGMVHAGDQIMVRQDGNDIHVMTGTGG